MFKILAPELAEAHNFDNSGIVFSDVLSIFVDILLSCRQNGKSVSFDK